MSQTTPVTTATTIPLPSGPLLLQAAKLAINQDKPIQMDYYVETSQGKAFLVEDSEDKKNRVLLKSRDEYTSLITNIFKPSDADDYIVMTENSIYIISGKVLKKRLPLASLSQE